MKRVAVAVLAFALAAALAVVARDVRRWQRAVDRSDVRFLVQPTEPGLWSGPKGTSGDLARRLLGVDDDVEFRRAEQLFIRGHIPVSTYNLERQRLTARGSAVALLEQLAARDRPAWRRAREATLLGMTEFEDAQGDAENGPGLVQQALRSFRTAIRTDAGADDAKVDLELVLTLVTGQGRKGRQPGVEESSVGNGAGLGNAGGGY